MSAPAVEAEWAVDTAQGLEMARLFADPDAGSGGGDTVVIHDSLAALVHAPFVAEGSSAGHVTVRRS